MIQTISKNVKKELTQCTLISLINVEPTLTNFEKFHPPQNKNPPSSFIDFLDFSTLHSSFIRFYVLVFLKNFHPPRLFQAPRLVIWQLLHPLHVYSKLHVY